jgi:hypothetical protein
MAKGSDFNQVHDVLDQLHESGVVNLDKSMREMLSPKDALGRLGGADEVATAVLGWDGYALVIKTEQVDVAELMSVSERLRRATGGPS